MLACLSFCDYCHQQPHGLLGRMFGFFFFFFFFFPRCSREPTKGWLESVGWGGSC